MKTILNFKIILLLSMLLLGAGCTSMQSMSSYARAGDTITIALGGSDTNALVPVIKKENLTVTITDAGGNTYPVLVRYVFQSYSDPASSYSYRAFRSAPDYITYNNPYQGQWLAVIDLVDPGTGNPLVLLEGAATIAVSSPELQTVFFGGGNSLTWTNGDLSSIPIEILPGIGSSNKLNVPQYMLADPVAALEPLPQVQVAPSGTPPVVIGGGEFVFSYVNADFTSAPKVIPATPDHNTQILSNHIDQGNGTSLLKIMVLNQHGFQVDDARSFNLQRGMSQYRSLTFGVIWDPLYSNVDGVAWQNSLQFVSGQYFDLDGNPMPELTTQVAKVR